MNRPEMPRVQLLTRDGCPACERAQEQLAKLAGELGFELRTVDVDAAGVDAALRVEFGDRLPVVLLDGREHSDGDGGIDEARLRADLQAPIE